MFSSGDVYISKQVDVYELLNSGDEDELMLNLPSSASNLLQICKVI